MADGNVYKTKAQMRRAINAIRLKAWKLLGSDAISMADYNKIHDIRMRVLKKLK